VEKIKRIVGSFPINMQIAVDYGYGIILASAITTDPTDHYQLDHK